MSQDGKLRLEVANVSPRRVPWSQTSPAPSHSLSGMVMFVVYVCVLVRMYKRENVFKPLFYARVENFVHTIPCYLFSMCQTWPMNNPRSARATMSVSFALSVETFSKRIGEVLVCVCVWMFFFLFIWFIWFVVAMLVLKKNLMFCFGF